MDASLSTGCLKNKKTFIELFKDNGYHTLGTGKLLHKNVKKYWINGEFRKESITVHMLIAVLMKRESESWVILRFRNLLEVSMW